MHDLRYALRLIAKHRGSSAMAILILSLCIGANTAVLSVVDAAMLRPLPYPEPDRLAQVVTLYRDELDESHNGRTWEAIRDHAPALAAAVYGGNSGVNMGVNGQGVYVRQQRVSTGFFRVLGVAPVIGREFTALEDRAGGPPAVILSYAIWSESFKRDRSVVGHSILLRGEPYTVVGVMPAGFKLPLDAGFQSGSPDLWTPLRPSREGEGSGENYGIIARLRPGVSWRQASSELAVVTEDLKREGSYPRQARLDIISLQQGMTNDLRKPLMVLWAAVAFVFVLGCVNIGGMLLARASGRVGEIATRLALGAPFARIARQLLVESTVLGMLGGVAGVAVGWAALAALRGLGSGVFPFVKTVDFDWRVLLATSGLTLLAGLAFGLAPAWQASRVDLRAAYSGSRAVAGRKRFIPMGALAGGQVALTVPLLIGAGLLLHTFLYLWNLNPGFDPNHVMTAQFSLQDARYSTPQKMNQLFDKTLQRLHETPGIEAAAVTLNLPYERGLNMPVRLPGQDRPGITNLTYVTPEYFAALRVPLLRGRLFTAADGPSSAPVAIVNEAFVKRYFKNETPLGQVLRLGSLPAVEIAGVVGDVEQRPGFGNYGPLGLVPAVYVPAAQTTAGLLGVHIWFSPNWIVRSSLPESRVIAAIESATHSADPLLPMAAFRPVRDLKLESLTFQWFFAALAGAIAGLAMLLSGLGIYGLTANLVAERTRELGIRMALGSTIGQAVRIALMPGLAWVLTGAIAGGAAALMLERFLRSFLWGVQPSDTATLAAVAVGLLAATLLASVVPAVRIARLNPADTLRAE
jgi:predicted permease